MLFAIYDTENAFAKINLFLCFNISKVPQNKPLRISDSMDTIAKLFTVCALVGLIFSNKF